MGMGVYVLVFGVFIGAVLRWLWDVYAPVKL